MARFGSEHTYNSDQSGFNLEIRSGRTLAPIGVKHVEVVAQSLASLTHSYTIMPTITATGRLLSPLLIVMKEAGGEFPARGVFQVSIKLHISIQL